jgi:hypothetical protein
MDDTMRDLLSKLDALLAEETTLQDLKNHPAADDPEIQKAIADKEKDEKSWVKDPSDPESNIPAYLRKSKAAGKDAARDTTDELNKKSGAQVWSSPREDIEEDVFEIGDEFGISLYDDFEIATEIVGLAEDGIIVSLDEYSLEWLAKEGLVFAESDLTEDKIKGKDGKACWKGYRYAGTENGKDKCVKIKESESIVTEREHWAEMGPEAIRILRNVYKETSQGVEPFNDKEGADRIGDALDNTARELGVRKYMRSLYDTASYTAHQDFDTNPGGFENWFNYVGDFLEKLYEIHKEKGSYGEDEPDTEIEKESAIPFAGKAVGHKEGPAGWLKGKDKRPARAGDLVGGESLDNDVDEAKYQGKEVPLNKKLPGDVKKSKVYVKKPDGKVVKVNFGDKKMRIKKSNPARRKSFRARHNCANPGPKWKARYWSCRSW